jgi:hypothetical protein
MRVAEAVFKAVSNPLNNALMLRIAFHECGTFDYRGPVGRKGGCNGSIRYEFDWASNGGEGDVFFFEFALFRPFRRRRRQKKKKKKTHTFPPDQQNKTKKQESNASATLSCGPGGRSPTPSSAKARSPTEVRRGEREREKEKRLSLFQKTTPTFSLTSFSFFSPPSNKKNFFKDAAVIAGAAGVANAGGPWVNGTLPVLPRRWRRRRCFFLVRR